jgi:[protein-PII] uridylyltransferase
MKPVADDTQLDETKLTAVAPEVAITDKSNATNQAQKDSGDINVWRQQLKAGFAAIKADFSQRASPSRLFKQHCKLTDNLLAAVWAKHHIDHSCCLIAVGGYGRGELYPHSDIDLLILLPEQAVDNHALNSRIEALIGTLWDLGLNVGHSVRSLNECLTEAKKDITVQTNLLESRLLSGAAGFYQEFLSAIKYGLDVPAFFAAKLKEQASRHAKFNDTAYNLEPNIKESPGGLRDLHMVTWLAQSLNIANYALADYVVANKGSMWKQLAKQNVISAATVRKISQH